MRDWTGRRPNMWTIVEGEPGCVFLSFSAQYVFEITVLPAEDVEGLQAKNSTSQGQTADGSNY